MLEGNHVTIEAIDLDFEDLIGSIPTLSGRDPGDFDALIEQR
jgi:hypothetical protein